MRSSWLVLALLGLGCILLVQSGCGEGGKAVVSEEPAGNVVEKVEPVVAKATVPVEPKMVAEKAKPELEKPEPPALIPQPVAAEPKPKPIRRRGPVKVEPDVNAAKGKPAIRFDKIVHDFGDVDPQSSNICEFGFQNAGNAVLKIINVRPDCGCTLFTLEKKEYAPGERGVLKIKYRAVTRGSVVTRRTVVTTNDPAKSTVTLTMKANIVQRVGYEPKRLNLLLKDEQTLPKVTLTSLDGKPFSINAIKSTVNAVTADFDPAVEATKFVLQVEIDKAQLRRVHNGVIEFALTHPGCKSISVPFSALARYKINPPVIILFDAEAGKSVIRNNVTILNNYQEDFEIASVKSQTGITQVLKREKIRYGYRLSLQITPPATGGSRKFTDEIRVQIKEGDLLKINCQGFYRRTRTQ